MRPILRAGVDGFVNRVRGYCNRTWYASEFDGKDIFFGLVSGLEVELGYFSLKELQEIRGPLGLQIERDLYFEPKTLKELMEMHKKAG